MTASSMSVTITDEENDKAISEYTEKLVMLIKGQDIIAEFLTLDDYFNMISLSDIVFNGAKFIFIGTNLIGQPAVPSISIWEYELKAAY